MEQKLNDFTRIVNSQQTRRVHNHYSSSKAIKSYIRNLSKSKETKIRIIRLQYKAKKQNKKYTMCKMSIVAIHKQLYIYIIYMLYITDHVATLRQHYWRIQSE